MHFQQSGACLLRGFEIRFGLAPGGERLAQMLNCLLAAVGGGKYQRHLVMGLAIVGHLFQGFFQLAFRFLELARFAQAAA